MKQERLRTLPAPWKGAASATVRALAKAERGAVTTLRRAVRGSVDSAIARLALLPANANGDAAIGIIQQTAPRITAAVTAGVEQVRRDGRAAGGQRLAAEWTLVTKSVDAALGPQHFGVPPLLRELDAEDRARAAAAGQAYGAAWALAALFAVTSSGGGDRTPAQRLDQATKDLDYRILRTAATENAQAFNDARDDGMGWVAERYKEARWFPALLKRWDATLDAKVCPTCRELDGAITLWGLPFRGGLRPGYVHPNDRCTPGIVFLPARIRGERIPGRQVDDERPRDAAA